MGISLRARVRVFGRPLPSPFLPLVGFGRAWSPCLLLATLVSRPRHPLLAVGSRFTCPRPPGSQVAHCPPSRCAHIHYDLLCFLCACALLPSPPHRFPLDHIPSHTHPHPPASRTPHPLARPAPHTHTPPPLALHCIFLRASSHWTYSKFIYRPSPPVAPAPRPAAIRPSGGADLVGAGCWVAGVGCWVSLLFIPPQPVVFPNPRIASYPSHFLTYFSPTTPHHPTHHTHHNARTHASHTSTYIHTGYPFLFLSDSSPRSRHSARNIPIFSRYPAPHAHTLRLSAHAHSSIDPLIHPSHVVLVQYTVRRDKTKTKI